MILVELDEQRLMSVNNNKSSENIVEWDLENSGDNPGRGMLLVWVWSWLVELNQAIWSMR
jgi:hypothetical protein